MDSATDISEALLAEWWQTKPNPVEDDECICGEINARNCPVHQ